MRACARAHPRAALSFRFAEHLHGSALGPISHLITHAATLRQGLASYARFSRLLTDRSSYELVEHEDSATLRCRWLPASPRMQRFTAEIILAFFFRVLRKFDRHVRPRHVSFGYAAPPHRSEYTRVFQHSERFNQPFTGIVFDRCLLDRPARHPDADVHAALQELAEQRLQRLIQQTPYTLRVRELLVRDGRPRRSDMTSVARELGTSRRSLHRRLAAEGKSYNEVVSEARALVAQQQLRAADRSIKQTAYDMGFADLRSFHRAFKRWTGMTPGEYRLACAARHDEPACLRPSARALGDVRSIRDGS